MAKKSFAGGLNSLLETTTKKSQEIKKPQRVITKTSQEGLKEGETRATFIVNEELLEKVKAIAYLNRTQIKSVIHEALLLYLDNQEEDVVNQAIQLYRKTGR